jgi:nucleotide-binding universal stress UspA family protein
MYQRILVATDGSDLSTVATNHAIELAALAGAELVIVNIVARYPQSYFEGGIALQPDDVERVEQQWADEGQRVVDAVAQQAAAKGVSAKAVVVRADVVSDALLEAVRQHRCDLMIMASHGRKGIKRLLLGSETQHVLTHAEVPVLVLK